MVTRLQQMGVDLRWIIVYWLLDMAVRLVPRTPSGDQLITHVLLWYKAHGVEMKHERRNGNAARR